MQFSQAALSIHLPWWTGALIAAVAVFSIAERTQRAQRKAKHREYLRSRAWRERRRAALARADNRCMDCGECGQLHVHHL